MNDCRALGRTMLVGIVALALAGTLARPAAADLILQDPRLHSSLITADRRQIRDDVFAGMIRNALIDNMGQSRVRDAKFLFQQCFGGGMLDDLGRQLGNTVNWVGGSASAHFQPAYGQLSPAEAQRRRLLTARGSLLIANRPNAFWTAALLPQLAQNQPLLQAIDNAAPRDPIRGLGPNRELGQSVFGGQGNTITLRDPGAQSHHAILFAGVTDYESIFNGMDDMRNALIQAWGQPGPNVSITMLYGDGQHRLRGQGGPGNLPWPAQPATRQSLQNVLNNLRNNNQLNPNEQFFFYGFDHGGGSNLVLGQPRRIARFSTDTEMFSLEEGWMAAMEDDPDNVATLTVDYTGLASTGAAEVLLNGTTLGMLDPAASEMVFNVSESLLSLDNIIEIRNNTDQEFDLTMKEFFTDAVAPDPVFVPEPPSLWLLGVAILASGLVQAGRMIMASVRRRQRLALFAAIVAVAPIPGHQALAVPLDWLGDIESHAETPLVRSDGGSLKALSPGDPYRADPALERMLAGELPRVRELLRGSQADLQEGRPKEAEAALRRALAAFPRSAAVHTTWARLLARQGKAGKAEAAFRKAVALDPKAVPPRVELGDLYLAALRDFRKAIDAYHAALALDGNHPGARYGLGTALAASGDTGKARAEWEAAARLAPASPLPFHALGHLHAAGGDYERALAAFAAALKAAPDFFPALLDRGDVFLAQGEESKALAAYENAVRVAPGSASAHVKVGTVHAAARRWAEAERAYLAAIALDPRQAIAYNNLAWMAAERKVRLDDAVEWARKAVELAPGVPNFQDTLAWVHRARGERARAAAVLERAARMPPLQPTVLYHLGIVYEEQGKRTDAVAAYRKALAIDQDFPGAADARHRLVALGPPPGLGLPPR